MAQMRIEWRGVDEVIPYENNPRRNDDAVEKVANILREFGWQQPLVVDADGVIIVGHTRLKAAKSLGMDKVPVIVASNLTPAQCAAYRIADNSTGELATWDFDLLSVELEGLSVDFDMGDFGIEIEGDWFTERERNDTSRQDGNDEYNDFLDKFEAKKTTDDCYTPDLVYDAVLGWVRDNYDIPDDAEIIRPFYPNGDYEHERYPKGCVVVDNPPFSILTEILRFYVGRGIRFFLFAPTLTLFTGRGLDICYLPVGVGVTYENGASVNTSFITNMESEYRVHVIPTLYEAVKEANDQNLSDTRKELPKYEFPSHVVTAAGLSRYAVHGVEFAIRPDECERISALDSMKDVGKALFGGGFLLSDSAALRNEEADRQKEENKRQAEIERMQNAIRDGSTDVGEGGTVVWSISDRERAIIASLGRES